MTPTTGRPGAGFGALTRIYHLICIRDGSLAAVADGLTDELIGALTQVAGLRVGFVLCGLLGLAAAAIVAYRRREVARSTVP